MSHAHDTLLEERKRLERHIEHNRQQLEFHQSTAQTHINAIHDAERRLKEVNETLDKLAELPQS